jgi:hypothetical protein
LAAAGQVLQSAGGVGGEEVEPGRTGRRYLDVEQLSNGSPSSEAEKGGS